MTREQQIAKRHEAWNDIKPHDALSGEITTVEFAVDNPSMVMWIKEDNHSDYVKGLIANGINYEKSGGGAIEFQSLIQWAVNGQHQLMSQS